MYLVLLSKMSIRDHQPCYPPQPFHVYPSLGCARRLFIPTTSSQDIKFIILTPRYVIRQRQGKDFATVRDLSSTAYIRCSENAQGKPIHDTGQVLGGISRMVCSFGLHIAGLGKLFHPCRENLLIVAFANLSGHSLFQVHMRWRRRACRSRCVDMAPDSNPYSAFDSNRQDTMDGYIGSTTLYPMADIPT